MIISALTEALLGHLKDPLRISKLEGDAVFLFVPKDAQEVDGQETRDCVRQLLLDSFDVFSEKLLELAEGRQCPCGACTNIERLRLKIIVHAGRALLYQIGRFEELSGVDVIVVHRLLKNSVEADQYLLMTEPAFHEMKLPAELEVHESQEQYKEVGEIRTYVCPRPLSEELTKRLEKRQLRPHSSFPSFTVIPLPL